MQRGDNVVELVAQLWVDLLDVLERLNSLMPLSTTHPT